ncbi:auxin response factor 9-like [Lycium barbarum]|uniref:auxin response factor 9-like n=1 Tax=Lycium barbarum TaxID=112863 RepID=UPI00293ECB2D|nr:auxin response factor 9-like [Lycium barbarum]
MLLQPISSQFIIGLDKYLEAVKHGYLVGMRIKMRFEGEENSERRSTGTIFRISDSSSYWKDSPWQSLMVQWDEPASKLRINRVSPWEIEPFYPVVQQIAMKNRRHRPHGETKISGSNGRGRCVSSSRFNRTERI